ncbi:RES family NAD+ phosphorylase [Pseudomonas japonica]|uniref:RES family NAD+ phosphorylase n=1 Tax=Pseudomonas japonica TaxID=256466 RepID=UPI0015E37FA5|nr:RES family NAD+ phosphorylase [Pseudomonas japonica]MBA1242552.1 RES family NAD+ phosphorylase [Pseudomonas japonica]
MKQDDVNQKAIGVLNRNTLAVVVEAKMRVYRVQWTACQDPFFYNDSPYSDSRWAHNARAIGVGYAGCSDALAVLEVFQHGKAGEGTPVLRSEVDAHSLIHFKTARLLKLVDAGELIRRMGFRPGLLIDLKGQGSEGYAFTQAVSTACCEYSVEIDGVLYPSSVYQPTGNPRAGTNVVLFAGRPRQLIPVSSTPLPKVILEDGRTVYELLEDAQVDLE